MQRFEYKVIPAPTRGEKARGLKTTGDRFALALTNMMNVLGRDGWEYVRADALPCDERSGLTGTKTTYQNMLVFRRNLAEGDSVAAAPAFVATPVVEPEGRRLGAAVANEGAAPAVGSARPEVAAE